MRQGTYNGGEARYYPETRMYSEAGEQTVLAEPGVTYLFPDVVITGDDGETVQMPAGLPTDGFWTDPGVSPAAPPPPAGGVPLVSIPTTGTSTPED
jgi:hypothetical protein